MKASSKESSIDVDRKWRKYSDHTIGVITEPTHFGPSPAKFALESSIKSIGKSLFR